MDESLLIRCDDNSFEFAEFGWFDEEPKTFYLTITVYPKGFLEKIKGIWKILRGASYGITDEIVVNNEEANKLKDWLNERLK